MIWLLNSAFHLTQDWGLAILGVSFLVRLCLFPLNLKQTQAMVKGRKLQPKLDELRKKYRDNAEELTKKEMELRKQEGVSIFGCLIPLFQLPIFIFLYRAITSLSISSGSVLIPWVVSLGSADPLHLLPILYGVLQVVGSLFKMTDGQNMLMLFSSLMVVFFLWNSSVGLGIYWVVNGLFGVAEGYYYRRHVGSTAKAS